MTEQLPYTFYTCTIVQHSCCEGVPEHVRAFLLQCAYCREASADLGSYSTRSHSSTLICYEKGIAVADDRGVTHGDIIPEGAEHLAAERYYTLFVSLAGNFYLAGLHINGHIVKTNKLRQADACLVEYYNNSTRAYIIKAIPPLHVVQKPVHLRLLQELW